MIADTVGTVGFSSLRGVMDTVTPLKVSLVGCLTNAVFTYLLMFPCKLGIAGAALGTVVSQIVMGGSYMTILLARKLVRWSTALRPPPPAMLKRLAASSAAVQLRAVEDHRLAEPREAQRATRNCAVKAGHGLFCCCLRRPGVEH